MTSQDLEIQKLLEQKESQILNLKKVIEVKNELLNATNDKVRALEQTKSDFEEALVSLTNEDYCDNEVDQVDTFVSSSSRAAKLEVEKTDFRVRLATLSGHVIDFCTQFKNNESDFDLKAAVQALEESLESRNPDESDQQQVLLDPGGHCSEESQWQVKMELEHERRLRTQAALDTSEKQGVTLRRELDNKTKQCEDLVKQLSDSKEKHQQVVKKVLILFGKNDFENTVYFFKTRRESLQACCFLAHRIFC